MTNQPDRGDVDEGPGSGEVEGDELRSLQMDAVSEILDDDTFPATTEELIKEYGDVDVEYPHGSERLENVLSASGSETYESADDAQLAILNGVSRDAVGRPRYSDRGDTPSQEDEWTRQPESF